MMTRRRNELQLLPEEEFIKGKKFSYFIRKWMNNHEERQFSSTPGYTPTTISPKLIRSRPQVYKANAIRQLRPSKDTKLVAIKVVELSDLEKLRIEFIALKKLTVKLKAISPRIIEGISFLPEKNLAFFAYEWFDEAEYGTLADILETEFPLYKNDVLNRNNAFKKLSRTLFSISEQIHKLGVIHGDLKPEHIMVRNKNNSPDFSDIRLIDFGLSYTKHVSHWRGGTYGFCNPYYWNEYNQELYSWNDLKAVDFYGIRAILYFVYTGEVYPSTTPAFRYLSSPKKSQPMALMYKKLNDLILSRFYSADPPNEFIDILERLGHPDDFFESDSKKSLGNKLIQIPKENYYIIFWFFSLLLMTLKSQVNLLNIISVIFTSFAAYLGIVTIKSSNQISKIAKIIFSIVSSVFIIYWSPLITPIGWVIMLWGTIASILFTIYRFFRPNTDSLPLEMSCLVCIMIPIYITFPASIFIPVTLGILLKSKEIFIRLSVVVISSIWTWIYYNFINCPIGNTSCKLPENFLKLWHSYSNLGRYYTDHIQSNEQPGIFISKKNKIRDLGISSYGYPPLITRN